MFGKIKVLLLQQPENQKENFALLHRLKDNVAGIEFKGKVRTILDRYFKI